MERETIFHARIILQADRVHKQNSTKIRYLGTSTPGTMRFLPKDAFCSPINQCDRYIQSIHLELSHVSSPGMALTSQRLPFTRLILTLP